MTICAISDTHGRHDQLDMSKYPADVLVHAGDWTAGSDLGLDETTNFFTWLGSQPYKHKICIAGNHERQVEAYGAERTRRLAETFNVIYLQDSSVSIGKYNFYGSPRSNQFYDWAFMEHEVGLSKSWAKIPEDTHVLLTHGPAYGTLDAVARPTSDDPHVGSESLARRKQFLPELLLHVCAHIHEGYGTVGQKPINVNASVLNEKYKLVNEPIIVTI